MLGCDLLDAVRQHEERIQGEIGLGWGREIHYEAGREVTGARSERIRQQDLEALVTRYLDEMGHAIGDPGQRDVRFVLLIERLYGEVEAERAEKRIRTRRAR
jgi:hypothetical protein